ncbi:hypothetical protein FGG78_30625 [Thioclava sp. BHET1]|nr:hypothetical protein FGG78_30625 [Thioclava sp. BHET1]
MMRRREFLISLAAAPLALQAGQAMAAGAEPSVEALKAARVLTGRAELSAVAIGRAEALLEAGDSGFKTRLAALAQAIGSAGPTQREAVIHALSDADAKTATELVTPLYLGFTGTPSTVSDTDSARFVTFLDALMYEPTADNLLRPTYARGGANYWTAPPAGVTVPAMDPNIAEWGKLSPKAAASYATPDPRYLVMAQGHAKTLAEAAAYVAAHNVPTTEPDNGEDRI